MLRTDLAGFRFGRLTVIRATEERKNGFVIWECKCDCGNTISVESGNLNNGSTRSCGCLLERHFIQPGERFGKLVVVRRMEERDGNGRIIWECLCDCGVTTYVLGQNLSNGNTRSCGCLKKDYGREKVIDLTGQKFGKLTAICATEERRYGNAVWKCKCDCGVATYVIGSNLRSGGTRSCGCLRPKKSKENLTKVNKNISRTKDLTGQKFGKLTAIRPTEERKWGYVVWECKCDCGVTTYVIGSSLRSGGTRSCGCLKREPRVPKKKGKDLTGQKFGRLTAIHPTEERRSGKVVWECKCDCGVTTYVISSSLRSGVTRSCGCLRQEKPKKTK